MEDDSWWLELSQFQTIAKGDRGRERGKERKRQMDMEESRGGYMTHTWPRRADAPLAEL